MLFVYATGKVRHVEPIELLASAGFTYYYVVTVELVPAHSHGLAFAGSVPSASRTPAGGPVGNRSTSSSTTLCRYAGPRHGGRNALGTGKWIRSGDQALEAVHYSSSVTSMG